MKLLAEQPQTNHNVDQFDRYLRTQNDTLTWAAEVLMGNMRTRCEFSFDGNELYAEDGGSIRDVFEDSIEAAEVIVGQKPNLLFELRRRLIEHGELEDMFRMARGELPNTMVAVSDFPPELMDATEDVGGYNTSRKQTMLRIITRQPDGAIRIITQSLDRSDRAGLEQIYRYFNQTPVDGELLEQRIYCDLTLPQQNGLPDILTKRYDDTLTTQYHGEWIAGIRRENISNDMNPYEFASSQHDLIEWFVRAQLADSTAAEKLRFKFAATVKARYESHYPGQPLEQYERVSVERSQPNAALPYLMYEIERAEQRSIARGETFSGCGLSVSAEQSATESSVQAGYGNKTTESTSYSFDKKAFCRSCQAPPKKGETEKMCGPCCLCRTCDRKYGGKG